jgi:enoyl-CoA hydratase/carnithine racemase
MCVADTTAKFQITETPRGLASSGKLINVMSYRGLGSFAVDVSITGRFFTAEEAHKAGVIDRLAPEGRHLEVARELAQTINKNPPLAVRACIAQRRWELEDRKAQALRYASLNKLYLSEDFAEATRAFVEKRAPRPFNAR